MIGNLKGKMKWKICLHRESIGKKAGMGKNMEPNIWLGIMRACRNHYEDPCVHSLLTRGKPDGDGFRVQSLRIRAKGSGFRV